MSSTELATRNEAGLIDLAEARRAIEQAGRDEDIAQLETWLQRLGELWAHSLEEVNKAGEVQARIEREVGLIDLKVYPLGTTSKYRPPFPISTMPKWQQGVCRKYAAVDQERFDAVVAEIWADPHRVVSTSALRVAFANSLLELRREAREAQTRRWRELSEQGLSHKEIGRREGISRPTISARLAPSAEKKRAAKKRQHAWQEARKRQVEQRRLAEMAERGDARGKAYELVDRRLLPLLDAASKHAGDPLERRHLNGAYAFAVELRDRIYAAGFAGERDAAAAQPRGRRYVPPGASARTR